MADLKTDWKPGDAGLTVGMNAIAARVNELAAGGFGVRDNGDGTLTLTGGGVVDNGDGTLTIGA